MFNMGMSGNKFNNGYGNQVSTNTSLYMSFSDTCQLIVRGWNEQLSFKFAPFKGLDANGKRQFAQDRSEIIATSLTKENAITMVEGIKSVILPALEKKESASITVTMGSDESKKAMTVSTSEGSVYLTINLGVNQENVASGDSLSHKFNIKEYIVGYEPSSGAGESVVLVNSDFINFMHILESAKDLNQLQVHNMNYGTAIKSSFTSTSGNSFGGYSNFNNNYNGGNQGSTFGNGNSGSNQTNVTNYNNMDEFLPFN